MCSAKHAKDVSPYEFPLANLRDVTLPGGSFAVNIKTVKTQPLQLVTLVPGFQTAVQTNEILSLLEKLSYSIFTFP